METNYVNSTGGMQNVQMTGNGQGKKRGLLGTICHTAVTVGGTAALGGGVGAAAGGLASLAPMSAKNKLVRTELKDVFVNMAEQAASGTSTLPEYLKNAGEQISAAGDYVKFAKPAAEMSRQIDLRNVKQMLEVDENSLRGVIGQAFEHFGVQAPEGYADDLQGAKNKILEIINKAIDPNIDVSENAQKTIAEKLSGAAKSLNDSISKYIENAPKKDELISLAKKEAKRVRRCNLVGRFAAIGATAALMALLFNLISSKVSKKGANNANQGAVQANAQAVPSAPAG